MLRQLQTLQDVVDWDMCTGCGACAFACDKSLVSLVNIESVGIRPKFSGTCGSCTNCLSICPGYSLDAELATGDADDERATEEFGSTLEIWEGYAADPEIRYRGSSGGVLSALALYCLERENMGFVLHTGSDDAQPWLNKTVQSRTRAELLSRTGSRYAPASPADGLAAIENSDRPCVFIGKPCDTAAVMATRKEHLRLDRRLGLVLTFFCAGTPSTQGTFDLIDRMGVKRDAIEQLRYRGEGWPGGFTVISDQGTKRDFISYEKAWGALTRYVSLRCHLCPDGLGRVADISCGDAWEKYDGASPNPGQSIVLVRTRRGQEILHRAVESGYVHLLRADADVVFAAQPNLLSRRRELFGRLLALKLLLAPMPRFRGFSLFHSWIKLSTSKKIKTIGGTLRRGLIRSWWRRRNQHRAIKAGSSNIVVPTPAKQIQ